ncbi:MAG: hypothetical protein ACR2KK_21760 [Acidimicrobiales bacterium]
MWRRSGAVGLLWALAGTHVLLGATAARAEPQVRLSTADGPVGSRITVIGNGFAPDEVEIRWGSQTGLLLTIALGPEFSVFVTVPDVPANSYPVMAVVRDGNSVSTSNASYQVTTEDEPAEPTTTTTSPPPEPTTVPAPVTTTTVPPTAPTTVPPRTTEVQNAAALARANAEAAAAAAAAAQQAAPTTTTTLPAALEPPAPPVSTTGQDVTDDGGAGQALGPLSTSQSAGAVKSPALLAVGLSMIVGGSAVLAVRNYRRGLGG